MSDRPNVVFILADDMGYGDFSAFNGGLSQTPTLDALLDESVVFTQQYTASPVCNPSRACLLTGRAANAETLFDEQTLDAADAEPPAPAPLVQVAAGSDAADRTEDLVDETAPIEARMPSRSRVSAASPENSTNAADCAKSGRMVPASDKPSQEAFT